MRILKHKKIIRQKMPIFFSLGRYSKAQSNYRVIWRWTVWWGIKLFGVQTYIWVGPTLQIWPSQISFWHSVLPDSGDCAFYNNYKGFFYFCFFESFSKFIPLMSDAVMFFFLYSNHSKHAKLFYDIKKKHFSFMIISL